MDLALQLLQVCEESLDVDAAFLAKKFRRMPG